MKNKTFIATAPDVVYPKRCGKWCKILSPSHLKINPFEKKVINLNIKLDIPESVSCHLFIDENLFKKGLILYSSTLVNGSDLVFVLFNYNFDKEFFFPSNAFSAFTNFSHSINIEKNEPIAKLVFSNGICDVEWEEVDKLDDTERAAGGFGSSGV